MIIKKSERILDVKNDLRGGKGPANINHIVSGDSLPNNVRLCAELTLAPGDSVGEHAHDDGECEVYFVISGECSVLDAGEYVKLYAGDVAKTDGTNPHALINDGKEEVKVLALVTLD